MKKIFSIFIGFILLFSLNIDAKDKELNKHKISSVNLKSDIDSSSNELYDLVFSGKKAFKDIENFDDPEVEEDVNNDSTNKTYYKSVNNSDKTYTKYTERYKFTDHGWFNYYESIEIGKKSKNGKEYAIESIQSFEYYQDISKCESDLELIKNDNCQSKNMKETKYSSYLNNYHIYEQLILKYDNKNNQIIEAFTSFVYKSRYDDELQTEEKILVSRDSKNRVVDATVYIYYKNKIYMKIFLKEPDLYGERYDVMDIYFEYEKDTYYDEEGNVYSIWVYDSNGHTYITTYTRSYYSGKKLGKNVVKYNYNDDKYYHSKTKYKSNGQKARYISYKFKYGKKIKRYEYVYNKNSNLKGNAYKYVTSYKMNKKGNMIKNKSYKYYYDKKGKVYKKITLKKHPRDFYVDEDYYDFDW